MDVLNNFNKSEYIKRNNSFKESKLLGHFSKSKIVCFIFIVILLYVCGSVYFLSKDYKRSRSSRKENEQSNSFLSTAFKLGFIERFNDSIIKRYNEYIFEDKISTEVNKYINYSLKYSIRDKFIRISYALYAPQSEIFDKSIQVCLSNLDFFAKYGIIDDPLIYYTFNVIGDTYPPKSLQNVMREHRNVEIVSRPLYTVDLTAHAEVINQYINSTDYFIFLNCGARGPYYTNKAEKQPLKASRLWIEKLLHKLDGTVRAVGPTVSCEMFSHVQSYALAVDAVAAQVASNMWTYNNKLDHISKLQIIAASEVGYSKELIRLGYNIASLDPRHEDQDFREDKPCDAEFAHLSSSIYTNPVSCRKDGIGAMIQTPGCRGVDPCEVMFIKNGGEVLRRNIFSQNTLDRAAAEERMSKLQSKPSICGSDVFSIRPYWDIPVIFRNISTYGRNNFELLIDTTSTDIIIIRVHGEYTNNLLSFLYNIESIDLNDRSIRVIIIPTEKGSYEVINKKLDTCFPISERRRIHITLVDIPFYIYDKYGAYIQKLCTDTWKESVISSGLHSSHDVSRHCSVNSPLHYLLVDVVIYYIKQSCSSCLRLVVTNADNFYSPRFYKEMTSQTNAQFDVIMSNMVTRGYLLRVKPEKGKVDLGAYSVSVSFLKKTGVTFLNSLPIRPKANDYHDADGYFLVHLTNMKANIRIMDEYLFYHN